MCQSQSNDGHAPEKLRSRYLRAVRNKDEAAVKALWSKNRGYVWGRFANELSGEQRRWIVRLWQSTDEK
jgi:hypothetical protein